MPRTLRWPHRLENCGNPLIFVLLPSARPWPSVGRAHHSALPQVWSPSGKRRPPSGRWVSTGKEALKVGGGSTAAGCKLCVARSRSPRWGRPHSFCFTPPRLQSGLNIPGVADSYDEGGNLRQARYAEGLPPGQSLLD